MWVRFIDDIFLIWKGDKDSLIDFLDYLNNVAPSIKFTHEISTDSVNFLDTTVLKDGQGYITTDVYQKPTDTHPYLHWTSAHPPHLKRSISYSQALRLRRICSSTDTLRKRIIEYSDFFVACGYERGKVLNEMQRVLTLTQEECLQTKERRPMDRIPLVGGCKPCQRPKCSWCNKINETKTFKSTSNNKIFTIFHSLDCQSSWVIYIIECNTCRLQYIGKSETGFNLRLNNHRNHIKKEVNSCELTEHFLHNVRSHNFDNDVTITVIEQIRKYYLTIDRKKELLRNREMFWQRMLNSIQPN